MTLSLSWQKILWALLIAVLLTVIGSSIYYLLGGFDKVEVYEVPAERKNIVGKYFKGYYAHPDLELIWNESLEQLKNGSLTGEMAVVNYQNDSLDNDEVEQFIGIALSGGMAEIPSGFEVLEIEMDKKLAVFLGMHPLVRPNPITIEKMFNAFAQENGLSPKPMTVELHFEDNSMSIEAPLE